MIKKHYEIAAPVGEVWQALTNPKQIEGWGGGPAKMSAEAGTEFSLWGGDIYGKNVEVVPEKKLVQEWYGGKWDKPSNLVFDLSEKDGKTVVDLTQTDVPAAEEADFDAGWDDYYLGTIKDYLEYQQKS